MKIATIYQDPKTAKQSVLEVISTNLNIINNTRDPQFSHVLVGHVWFQSVKISSKLYANIRCTNHSENCIRDLFEDFSDLQEIFKKYVYDPRDLIKERFNI